MRTLSLISAILLCGATPAFAASSIDLGAASSFGVLAGSAITNTGATFVGGNVGVSPGTSITGFPPGAASGSIYSNGAITAQAQTDLASAYTIAAALSGATDLSGLNLGGMVLLPGVYKFNAAADLTGNLILDGLNDPNSVFVFQIGSSLTTAAGSSVTFANGGDANNLFWQAGASATLGANSQFAGSILALTSITFGTGATLLSGRALAEHGAVTLDANVINVPTSGVTAVPESATWMLMIAGLGMVGLVMRRRTKGALRLA